MRQLDFGFFGGFLEPLDGHSVLADIDALVLLEFRGQPFDNAIVNVIAAQVRVAGGGLYFHHAFADFQNGDIERAAAQVVHGNGLVFFLIQAVGERRRRGFVDDAQHFQARDFAGLLGRLPLAVVEISGYRDDGLGHFLAQKILRRCLQLLQNHRGNFRRAVRLAENVDARVIVRSACVTL